MTSTGQGAAAWIAPRRDGRGAWVALFNLSDEELLLSLRLPDAGVTGTNARELWTDEIVCGDEVSAALAPHDAAVWLVTEA